MNMKYDGSKSIFITNHAKEQCKERGVAAEEVIKTIQEQAWIAAKKNRLECKASYPYTDFWNGQFYTNKEVRPIFVEEEKEIVVVTVYVYYN